MGSDIDRPENLQSTSPQGMRAMASLNPSLHALPAAATPGVVAVSCGGGSACSAIHLLQSNHYGNAIGSPVAGCSTVSASASPVDSAW